MSHLRIALFTSIMMMAAMSANIFAADMLFSGAVQHQVVTPSGTPDCAPPCPANNVSNADGTTHVCISNAGGCQLAEIMVLHDFLGHDDGALKRIGSRTGEWGKLHFPDSTAPVLVYVHDDSSLWTPIHVRDGVESVDAAFLKRLKGLDLADLHPDADGRIPVTQLARALAH